MNLHPDDDAFLGQFEACTLPFDQWCHRAHLRVALVYLARHPLPEAIDRMRRGIRAYNASNEVPEGPQMGYHETVTQAWMRLLHAVMHAEGARVSPGADAFLDEHPFLLDRRLLLLYYSRPRILSEEAQASFVEPDLAPLPRARRAER